MASFGARLKEVRLKRRLSQTELGGERYSGSYVSHLETGRRVPTPEVVDYLASRLRITPADLAGTDGAVASDTRVLGLAIAELNARSSWEARDFTGAIEFAELARRAAIKEGRSDAWWTVTYLKAQSLLALEEYPECVALAEELLHHHFADGVGELQAEALALASRASRAQGRLDDALQYAERATEAASGPGLVTTSPQRAQALLALVSALGELGRLDEADEAARALDALGDQVVGDHLRGLIAWSVGNIAMMRGRIADGIARHDQAADLLNPAGDLRAWGRFCKASAAQRLAAGTLEGVARLLEGAAHALALVGNTSDRLELTITSASFELAEGRVDAALRSAREVDAHDTDLPPQTRAELAWLCHQCHLALGEVTTACTEAARAAELFEEAGALPRALEAWRAHAALLQRGTVEDAG